MPERNLWIAFSSILSIFQIRTVILRENSEYLEYDQVRFEFNKGFLSKLIFCNKKQHTLKLLINKKQSRSMIAFFYEYYLCRF